MEITTPPNPSGFAKKPKSKKGTPGRNRKSKKHSLRRTTLNMELKILHFLCRNIGGKDADWFLGCISILMMAGALRDYFDTEEHTADEQAAV